VTGTVGIIGVKDRQIEEFVRGAGMRPVILQIEDLASPRGALATTPDVVIVDVRADRHLLTMVAAIKRRHPSMGVAIVVPTFEPELMLQAMRAGVTECVAEPLTQGSLESAIGRVMVQRATPVEGRVFAMIGAKGGVGATTIAVNFAEAIARSAGETLLIDFERRHRRRGGVSRRRPALHARRRAREHGAARREFLPQSGRAHAVRASICSPRRSAC
jgi:hypothetical protein